MCAARCHKWHELLVKGHAHRTLALYTAGNQHDLPKHICTDPLPYMYSDEWLILTRFRVLTVHDNALMTES
jgi:hypothetical protein